MQNSNTMELANFLVKIKNIDVKSKQLHLEITLCMDKTNLYFDTLTFSLYKFSHVASSKSSSKAQKNEQRIHFEKKLIVGSYGIEI